MDPKKDKGKNLNPDEDVEKRKEKDTLKEESELKNELNRKFSLLKN